MRPALISALLVGILAVCSRWQIVSSEDATCPEVTTVRAATEFIGKRALLLKPNGDGTCAQTNLDLLEVWQFIDSAEIQRIDSIASSAQILHCTFNPLTRGADVSKSILTKAKFSGVSRADLSNFVYPTTLVELEIAWGSVASMSGAVFPSGLASLALFGNKLTSIADLTMPPKLRTLDVSSNPITSLSGVNFPASLQSFNCRECQLTSVRGIKWPKGLVSLFLATENPITDFEISASDLPLFQELKDFTHNIIQSSCESASAKLVPLGSAMLCVLNGGGADDGSKIDESNGSKGAISSGSGTEDSSSPSSPSDNAQGGGEQGTTSDNPTGTANGNNGGSGRTDGETDDASEDGSPGGSPSSGTVTASDGDTSATALAVIIVVGFVFVVLIGIVSYRIVVARRQQKQRIDDTDAHTLPIGGYARGETPSTRLDGATTYGVSDSSQEYMGNDIRNDKLLLAFRIDQKDITLSKQIARGGYGVIYRGTYQRRDVAVKQMLPDSWRNERILSAFMDEIRMCARLEHPKIVSFIGLAWSSLRDVSVIIEYMAGGDLFSTLHQHHQSMTRSGGFSSSSASSGREWFERWTPQQLQCKVSIARDVAEAMVYLHSFNSPILHRDLKARNVLLDVEGHAKLSDFGISREMSVDETMTSEIGTAAWIAPEVLRGERYSERADIYSFGVLLVEMDRGSHPYAGQHIGPGVPIVEGGVRGSLPYRESTTMMAHKNAQIAVFVSTGKLRPRVSEHCPASIEALAKWCLSFDAADRPTSVAITHALRQLCRGRQ